MGRVLLAYQPDWVLDAYFRRATLQKLTEFTEINPAALRQILRDVRAQGFASIQDELDYGIASVALPIFGKSGRVVAAANCSDATSRSDKGAMVARRLPVLQQAVHRIESMLAQHPELESSVESVGSDYVRPRSTARVAQPPAPTRTPLRIASRISRRRN
jgi:IclR family pca regulon transcriptional regulator